MKVLFRNLFSVLVLVGFAACTRQATPDEPSVSMGDFRLGHNIVVADAPQQGPFSRTATDEELIEALKTAISGRFGAYEGEKFYNFGAKIDAYALALPGVPIVFNPKSVLVITMSIWDDETGETLNEESKVFTVFEGVSGKTLLSSGLTQNKAKQMANLSNNAAKEVQKWILENPEWIGLPPEAAAEALAEITPEDVATEELTPVDAAVIADGT